MNAAPKMMLTIVAMAIFSFMAVQSHPEGLKYADAKENAALLFNDTITIPPPPDSIPMPPVPEPDSIPH